MFIRNSDFKWRPLGGDRRQLQLAALNQPVVSVTVRVRQTAVLLPTCEVESKCLSSVWSCSLSPHRLQSSRIVTCLLSTCHACESVTPQGDMTADKQEDHNIPLHISVSCSLKIIPGLHESSNILIKSFF